MDQDEINRKQVLDLFLETIECISNKEYQMRVWVRGEGPECDDFTETVCCFFDHEEFILRDYKKYGITESQYLILKKFRDEFEYFVDEFHTEIEEEFIDTPEWARIMSLAKEVLEVFNYKKDSTPKMT